MPSKLSRDQILADIETLYIKARDQDKWQVALRAKELQGKILDQEFWHPMLVLIGHGGERSDPEAATVGVQYRVSIGCTRASHRIETHILSQ